MTDLLFYLGQLFYFYNAMSVYKHSISSHRSDLGMYQEVKKYANVFMCQFPIFTDC